VNWWPPSPRSTAIAEDALQLISVDYDVLPFVLDQKSAQADEDLAGRQCVANAQRSAPISQRRGDLEAGFRAADHVRDASPPLSCTTQMEPRVALAQWSDKLTSTHRRRHRELPYRHARDLGVP
jgi:CO/xanthine dehydrogenase Mo-binding subunit